MRRELVVDSIESDIEVDWFIRNRDASSRSKQKKFEYSEKSTFKNQNKNEISSNRHKTIPKFRNGQ